MEIVYKKIGGCLLKFFLFMAAQIWLFAVLRVWRKIDETLKLHNFLENEDKTTNLVSKFSESKYLIYQYKWLQTPYFNFQNLVWSS